MINSSSIITKFQFGVVSRALQKPYVLSFTTVKHIESVWVFAEDDAGIKGIGEAVPLFGYGSEHLETIEEVLGGIRQELVGASQDRWFARLEEIGKRYPFAASAAATALDFITWHGAIPTVHPIRLVYPIGAKGRTKDVASQVESGLAQGYRHFKMKVGSALKNDIRSSRFVLQEYVGKDVTVRFDANQAYSLEEAVTYCSALEDLIGDGMLWIEQPLDKDDWEGMKILCRRVSCPLILDECIYNEDDVARAKDVGCTGIKLKLFKHPGMNACLRLARAAYHCGLQVIMGNGVASDIGNLCEALVISSAPGLFAEGAECNGYVKLMSNIAFPHLAFRSGSLVWDGPPVIDLQTVQKVLREESIRFYGT